MATQVRKDLIRNSFLIFLGGISYGFMATVFKLAYAQGFSFEAALFGQVFCAWCIMGALVIARRLRLGELQACTRGDLFKLVGTGCVAFGTSFFFSLALTRLTASVATTLLFQFTWMGVALEAIMTRRTPSRWSILAAIVIGVGTLGASGVLQTPLDDLDFLGIAFGLLSAVCYTVFMYATGNAAPALPAVQRGFLIITGSLACALVMYPGFFASGALQDGLLKYSVLQALSAMVVPVLLFAVAAPWLPSGLVAILASSELPGATVCAMIVLGERVGPLQIVGIVIILAGVVISQVQNLRPGDRPPDEPPSPGVAARLRK